jgi:phosphoribosylanthranilate isomerase
MDIEVKICGLTRAVDVKVAADAGANYLGFIVEAESSRRLSCSEASTLIAGVQAKTVAVTVDPTDTLVQAIGEAGFTHIQLHGDETLARTAEVAQSGLSVIKAVPVSSADDVKLATEYSGAADLLLFDAKPPKGAAQRGGHGLSFDWSILKFAPTPKRYLLAGGLTVDNVSEAVTLSRATGVDVSSGVERSAGIKDAVLINQFVERARA